MPIRDDEWFEIWSAGEDAPPVYLLTVVSRTSKPGTIDVLDPLKGNVIVFSGKDYQTVCDWLWEDEFSLVEGRKFPSDGY
jgi:hypothetical protein